MKKKLRNIMTGIILGVLLILAAGCESSKGGQSGFDVVNKIQGEPITSGWSGTDLNQKYYLGHVADDESVYYLFDTDGTCILSLQFEDRPVFYDEYIAVDNEYILDYEGNVVFDISSGNYDEMVRTDLLEDEPWIICLKEGTYYQVNLLEEKAKEVNVANTDIRSMNYCGDGYYFYLGYGDFVIPDRGWIYSAVSNEEYSIWEDGYLSVSTFTDDGDYQYYVDEERVLHYYSISNAALPGEYRLDLKTGQSVFCEWDTTFKIGKHNTEETETEYIFRSETSILDAQAGKEIKLDQFIADDERFVVTRDVFSLGKNGYIVKLIKAGKEQEQEYAYIIISKEGEKVYELDAADQYNAAINECADYVLFFHEEEDKAVIVDCKDGKEIVLDTGGSRVSDAKAGKNTFVVSLDEGDTEGYYIVDAETGKIEKISCSERMDWEFDNCMNEYVANTKEGVSLIDEEGNIIPLYVEVK